MKTQLLYNYKCFSLIFTGCFFFLNINKKDAKWGKHKILKYMFTVCFLRLKKEKTITEGTCIFLHSVLINTEKTQRGLCFNTLNNGTSHSPIHLTSRMVA